MFARFSKRTYVSAVIVVVVAMLLGTAAALALHINPSSGEAGGGILALGIVAILIYMSRSRRR